jgi:hypothetical protein
MHGGTDMTNQKLKLVSPESHIDRYADLTFGSWLGRLGRRLFVLIGTGWVASSLAIFSGGLSKIFPSIQFAPRLLGADSVRVLQTVTIINAAVIFGILLLPPRGPKTFAFSEGDAQLPASKVKEHRVRSMIGYHDDNEWQAAKHTAVTVMRQFEHVWTFLWLFWLLLSLTLVVTSFFQAGDASPILQITRTLFSNCNTLTMLFCYEILAKPTTEGSSRFSRPEVDWSRWAAIVIVFTFLQGLLIVARPATNEIFDWISGMGAAIAFALFVSRLASRYFEPPTWFLVTMYAYVALQPLFPYLVKKGDPLSLALLIDLALLFKCLLYLYMMWLFHSGRLLFYVLRLARMEKNVSQDWQHFADTLERS